MNYYQRHLGDYARDTGHLSLLEHGVYQTLLDWQYASEQALPASDGELFRLCRAMSRAEKTAVERIRKMFFDAQGWNKRARNEIQKCNAISEANSFAAMRRHHPEMREWSDEQLRAHCGRIAGGVREACARTTTRARSKTPRLQDSKTPKHPNTETPTSVLEGGAIAVTAAVDDRSAFCQVGDDEVLAWAASWPGEPGSGTPKFNPDWITAALVKLNGRNQWPTNWKRWLISCWRQDHRNGFIAAAGEGVVGESQKKNRAPISASVALIERQKKIAALSAEEDELSLEINSLRLNNLEVPKTKLDRWHTVRKEIVELNGGAK